MASCARQLHLKLKNRLDYFHQLPTLSSHPSVFLCLCHALDTQGRCPLLSCCWKGCTLNDIKQTNGIYQSINSLLTFIFDFADLKMVVSRSSPKMNSRGMTHFWSLRVMLPRSLTMLGWFTLLQVSSKESWWDLTFDKSTFRLEVGNNICMNAVTGQHYSSFLKVFFIFF